MPRFVRTVRAARMQTVSSLCVAAAALIAAIVGGPEERSAKARLETANFFGAQMVRGLSTHWPVWPGEQGGVRGPLALELAAQCDPGTVPRPAIGLCSTNTRPSPLLDPRTGVYRAERDPNNWVRPDRGAVLELRVLYVVENGEGITWPHGPHGNFHYDVFAPDEPLARSADGAKRRRFDVTGVLRGPHRTHDTVDEWRDDELLRYRNAGLFRWGSEPGTNDSIVLRIRESDSSDDGMFGRRDDVLGMERVERAATERNGGVWVPFHAYTNDHPRRRTDDVKLWALLRTSR